MSICLRNYSMTRLSVPIIRGGPMCKASQLAGRGSSSGARIWLLLTGKGFRCLAGFDGDNDSDFNMIPLLIIVVWAVP